MKIIISFILALSLFACSDLKTEQTKDKPLPKLSSGNWLLTFHLNKNIAVPSNFQLQHKDSSYEITFTNASEKIVVTDVKVTGNKITIHDPVFNNWFEGDVINNKKIEGFWFKNDSSYKIPFTANLI